MTIKGLGIPSHRFGGPQRLTGAVIWHGSASAPAQDTPFIVVAPGLLTPMIVYQYPKAAAFVSEQGSWASHGVMMARERGIPCLVALGGAISLLRKAQRVHVDIVTGIVTVLSAEGEVTNH